MNLHLISSLRQAVEDEYGCVATLRRIVTVVEKLGDGMVWECEVAVFSLADHPTAEIAYAWSGPTTMSDSGLFYAGLHAGPVDSPETAVRAAPH
jgi:hypothetical protein